MGTSHLAHWSSHSFAAQYLVKSVGFITILHGGFIALIICKSVQQSLYSLALHAFKGLWFVSCLQNFPESNISIWMQEFVWSACRSRLPSAPFPPLRCLKCLRLLHRTSLLPFSLLSLSRFVSALPLILFFPTCSTLSPHHLHLWRRCSVNLKPRGALKLNLTMPLEKNFFKAGSRLCSELPIKGKKATCVLWRCEDT